ncbi:transmembrane and immunoglobulin domain-containing protein 2 [Amia ocellicauda]|uniref:transmembrane and immunoglobulin domain-containing protein 2 n=1 Tax=Amia ocellicauda TaxID=2972642 RepID=UPI0034649EB0
MRLLTTLLGCLLLSSLSSRDVNGKIYIMQSPHKITVRQAESVQMLCCWETDLDLERIRVEWWKDRNRIKSSFHNIKNGSTEVNLNKCVFSISRNCSKLTISKVSKNDTGKYLCKAIIEIPKFITAEGSGTNLTVEAAENIKTDALIVTITAIITSLAVVFLLLGVSLLWYYKRKTHHPAVSPGSTGAGTGERHEVELGEKEALNEAAEGSTDSSRGSTQWALSSIYESFDYFAVQD